MITNIEDFEKLINNLCYDMNFGIEVNQQNLKLFYENYEKFREKLNDKFSNFPKDIIYHYK